MQRFDDLGLDLENDDYLICLVHRRGTAAERQPRPPEIRTQPSWRGHNGAEEGEASEEAWREREATPHDPTRTKSPPRPSGRSRGQDGEEAMQQMASKGFNKWTEEDFGGNIAQAERFLFTRRILKHMRGSSAHHFYREIDKSGARDPQRGCLWRAVLGTDWALRSLC